MYYVGVMSGTSCDGVDISIVEFDDKSASECQLIAAHTIPYPDSIKSSLSKLIADQPVPISMVSQLDAQLGAFYAVVINEFLSLHTIESSDVMAIGLHGQTVCHQPKNESNQEFTNTIQLGSASIVTQQTNVDTVANFRQMDVAYGGQGAPLAPALHQQLFKRAGETVVVLNLGGIANITLLRDGNVIGFDTGPASCMMDEYIKAHQGVEFDAEGQWASTGQLDRNLLDRLLKDDYFHLQFPKSTGRELFNMAWLNAHLAEHFSEKSFNPQDIQRTLLQLVVESIAMALNQVSVNVDQMVVCGGGVHNKFLMQQLQLYFDFPVCSSAEFGHDPDFVESILMAWLAKQNLNNCSLALESITGCSKPHVYGVRFRS